MVIGLALMLGGCVTAELSNLDERTSIISGRGTSFDNPADVARVVLARAATEAQARGFSHFAILSVEDRSRLLEYQTPVTTQTATEERTNCNRRRCTAELVTTTTTSGGEIVPDVEPGSDVTVRFLHGEEVRPGARDVWEAASVLAVQRRK
jgi:hypothetical protein